MTYRRKGHAEHDNQSYVPDGEIERWARENDPLDRYVKRADRIARVSAPTSSAAIDARVSEEIDRATDEAEQSPPPEPRDALDGRLRRPGADAGALVPRGRAERGGRATSAPRAGGPTMAEVTYLEAIRQAPVRGDGARPRRLLHGRGHRALRRRVQGDRRPARRGSATGRVIDTPISETGFVGAAAGAAHMGMRPVCEMQFIDFVSCAYSILTNYVATARYRAFLPCPWWCAARAAATCAAARSTRRTPRPRSSTRPGLKIVYPATARDAKGLLKAAIRDDDCVLFFEHKYLYRRIKEELPAGRSRRADRQGEASPARGRTSRSSPTRRRCGRRSRPPSSWSRRTGSRSRCIDLRSLLPMDDEAIVATVKKTNRVLIVHEDTVTGGIAGEITARINELAFEWLDAPIRRVAAHDVPLPYAPQLEDFVLPQTADIVRAARWLAAEWAQPGRYTELDQTCDKELNAWPTIDVIMPQMGESIAEGTLSRWIKKVGDAVKRDEPIFEISTDKVDAEIPAPAAGMLAEILVQEGQTVAVQTVVARIETDAAAGAEMPAAAAPAPAAAPRAAAPAPPRRTGAAPASAPPAGRPPRRPRLSSRRRVPRRDAARRPSPRATASAETAEERLRRRSTPLVRKIAAEHNLDISAIPGTGLAGRVTKNDVLGYHRERRRGARRPRRPPAPARRSGRGGRRRPAAPRAAAALPGGASRGRATASSPGRRIRKLTAEHMVMSRRVSPHVNTIFEIDYTRDRAAPGAGRRRNTPSAA